jgi:hypothetical protein
MSLQVNLIQPDELRSASRVSVKTYVLLVGLVTLAVFGSLIAHAILTNADQQYTLKLRQQEWQDVRRNRQIADRLRTQLQEVSRRHDSVLGWSYARVPWHAFLDRLQEIVPPTIQLRSLQMRAVPETRQGEGYFLNYSMTLSGYSVEADADRIVPAFRDALQVEPPFDKWIAAAEVTSFRRDDAEGAPESARVFQIRVDFNARSFNAPAE